MALAKRYTILLLFLYILAHALALLSLPAFGFQAGGWVLHPRGSGLVRQPVAYND